MAIRKDKNMRIKAALASVGMTQGDLARLLDMTEPDMSRAMMFELAKAEQDEIIRKIKAAN